MSDDDELRWIVDTVQYSPLQMISLQLGQEQQSWKWVLGRDFASTSTQSRYIFDSSIVRQADIHSYSVTIIITAGKFILELEVDDDDDAFKKRWRKNH